jgi:hypothetical protein
MFPFANSIVLCDCLLFGISPPVTTTHSQALITLNYFNFSCHVTNWVNWLQLIVMKGCSRPGTTVELYTDFSFCQDFLYNTQRSGAFYDDLIAHIEHGLHPQQSRMPLKLSVSIRGRTNIRANPRRWTDGVRNGPQTWGCLEDSQTLPGGQSESMPIKLSWLDVPYTPSLPHTLDSGYSCHRYAPVQPVVSDTRTLGMDGTDQSSWDRYLIRA